MRAVSAAGGGEPSAAVQARTRPQLVLKADAGYPLETRAWPAAEAPATHTWTAHDATVALDIVGRVAGTEGWYRVLRFGAGADGPYWLPAAAVTVAGGDRGCTARRRGCPRHSDGHGHPRACDPDLDGPRDRRAP